MTLEDVTRFWEWFDKTRGDLAIRQVEKRARCPRGRIGNAYSARKEPTPLVCDSIAAGLGIDKSEVLELAGIVPSGLPPVSEEEAGQILRRLPVGMRAAVMTMLRGLSDQQRLMPATNPSVAESRATYDATRLSEKLLIAFERLPSQLQERALRFVEELAAEE